ncbi:hypothetical protein F5B21DRAFT_57118 [Xylaria acuta]|nr:hypothetical protein F5B21DRAFT_57118 [Xylaria acuta]
MASIQPKYRCDCKRSFATAKALAQHRRDSPRHQDNPLTNNSNIAVPTPTFEPVTKGKAAMPVAVTEPIPATNANLTPAPDQKLSTGQNKKNKKRNNKGSKKPQTSASSGSSTFNPRHYYGYTLGEGLGYPRYSSPMYVTWEDVYKMEGPDHTQCTSDCDWCGMCAYRTLTDL